MSQPTPPPATVVQEVSPVAQAPIAQPENPVGSVAPSEPREAGKKEESKKEAPKETFKEEPLKEVPKEEPLKEAPKEEAKTEAPKEEPLKETKKEEPKEAPKEEPKTEEPKKEEAKEAPKEEPKKEEAKEAPKEEPKKEEAKEAPKEEPKKEEAKKEETKEPPKEETKKEEPKKEEAKKEAPKEEPAESGPFRFFAPASVWNQALPANAPLESNSAEVIAAFAGEITTDEEAKKGPNINTSSWSVPVYTVPASEPTVKVTLENVHRAPGGPALQQAWEDVPLPSNAKPAVGTDKHLVVWQPSTNKLWEFWDLEKTEAGWQAGWGGAMDDESADLGYYDSEAWPGATTYWGASATSLSIAGGLITLEDLERGQINHALAMSIPNPRGEVFAWPAQRTDGWSSEATTIPEGAHLRLDPNLKLAELHLPKLTLMLAEAAQRYGIVIRDSAANVALYGQDPTPTGWDPYTGTHGYYEGKPAQQILAAFPWSHLELLKMELHKP
jgi:hypothetical protein